MFGICEEDRKCLRFLWPNEDGNISPVTWRLKKLPFGVSCSHYILNAVLAQHWLSASEAVTVELREITELLRRSFYVDNCLSSVETNADADAFVRAGWSTLASAGMKLRKWRSNAQAKEISGGAMGSVLEVTWDPAEDVLKVPFSNAD